jgi:hypothetical protein
MARARSRLRDTIHNHDSRVATAATCPLSDPAQRSGRVKTRGGGIWALCLFLGVIAAGTGIHPPRTEIVENRAENSLIIQRI